MPDRPVLHPAQAAQFRPHRPLDTTRRTVLRADERFLPEGAKHDDHTERTSDQPPPLEHPMTAIDTAPVTPRTSAGIEIDAAEAKRMLVQPGTILVDCRESDEHARERIPGAKLIPLSGLTAREVGELCAKRVIIHCRSGRRSLDAATRCSGLANGGVEVLSMAGGIEAWRGAGFGTEVNTTRPKLGVMQQTQLTIGACVTAGVALGFFVHPAFLALPAFMGLGLVFAGATGTCGLATLLSMAPWNRLEKCAGGSCSTR